MIKLYLTMFGGGGGGSGGGTGGGTGGGSKKSSVKLGDEINSSKGIKKDQEYLITTNKGERTIRTGAQLLKQIEDKTLKYDDDIYHWVSSKGSYTIRRITRRKK